MSVLQNDASVSKELLCRMLDSVIFEQQSLEAFRFICEKEICKFKYSKDFLLVDKVCEHFKDAIGSNSSSIYYYRKLLFDILTGEYYCRSSKIKKVIEDLTISERIRKGDFGDIFVSYKQGIPNKYTTKVINQNFKDKLVRDFNYNEISILKDIHHPNVLKLIEIKESLQKLYIVTEYYNGGNLSDYYQRYLNENNKPFSEEIVQYIMRQIFDAMKYLHNKKIIHRKLSLENIMINYEDEKDRINNNVMKSKIIIVDFEYAKYLKKDELTSTVLGVVIYMDPILLNKLNKVEKYKNANYDEKVDIWSLGIIFYELLYGLSPFHSDNMEELLNKVNKGDYFVPLTFSKEAISFLNCMLQYNPKKRLTADKLYNHKFLRRNIKEFSKINTNELKDLKFIDNSNIKINTENNELIWNYFGSGFEDDL